MSIVIVVVIASDSRMITVIIAIIIAGNSIESSCLDCYWVNRNIAVLDAIRSQA